ncbi:hypothetical protein BD311DRAFT_791891 [Dichomitus squalens]|uniref:F-box domain-containing protein n=1 Tax=Dichomitus squalens TaxID=114155 RepID=A0A4Q9MBD3_9APHY|nr:hypothetical protein BD311DRAFT_791891 [Dichomitus squalens]
MTSQPVPQEGSYVEQSIRPLMKLRNLLSLTVHATNVPQVTEAELVSMADALPLLTTLRTLETPAVGLGDAEPGPVALVALATQCPNLEVLQLHSCYIPKSVFSRLTEYPVLDHPLKTVFFSTFRTDDYQYAALLFDRLFPHVDFEPQTPTDGPASTLPGYFPHPSWTQLCAEVRALQMTRQYHEERPGISPRQPDGNAPVERSASGTVPDD